jgi:hypothetical protein
VGLSGFLSVFLGVGTGFLGRAVGGCPNVRECSGFIADELSLRRLSRSGSVFWGGIHQTQAKF